MEEVERSESPQGSDKWISATSLSTTTYDHKLEGK